MLHLYEICSGQIINKDKSSIMFSKNTKAHDRRNFMDVVELTQESMNDKYLGLPVYMERSKASMFAYLKERVWKKIQGWKEKLLSKAGKTLITAVAQAIPSYAMSCFDLTKSLCDDMSQMICRFWWGQQDKENKMHWVSWEKICQRKEKGGLGYRDLHLFGTAGMVLNTKSGLLVCPDIRARYGAGGSLLEANEGPGISYTWRSIIRGLQALQKGLVWRVGDGSSIRILDDPWIGYGVTRRPITPRGQTLLTNVEELMDPEMGRWDEQTVHDIFWEEDVLHTLATPMNPRHEDRLAWHFDQKGLFSVKSAYHVLDDDKERA